MNVQLENLPNCLISMRIEVPAEEGAKTWNNVAGEYARQARLPGYRPGKAPRTIVEAKFRKEIKEEVQGRLLSNSVRDAVREHNIRYLAISNVEEVEFADDRSLRFTATLIAAPVFEMPEYKGLAVEVPSTAVTDAEIEDALGRLREQFADFTDVSGRPVAADEFAVITYTGTLDGQPVDEAAPGVSKRLSGNTDFWIRLSPDALLPGFSEKIVGAEIGETREFDLALPADFALTPIAGKTLHYSVTLGAIKERTLPEIDDAFADKLVEGKTLADVREIIRGEIARQKEFEAEQQKRNQIVTQLIAKVECELPEGHVRNETQRLLDDLIRENSNRGVPDEEITERQEEMRAAAAQAARDRLKASFILVRIAEEEKIVVTRDELEGRLHQMAVRYEIPLDRLRKDLEKADALGRVHEEVLTAKVLDFLASNASVTEAAQPVEAATEAEAPEAPKATEATEATPEAATEAN